jgi:hypothetical protein
MSSAVSKKPFYVYGHYTTSGKLFYIGKGTGRRAWAVQNRTKDWKVFASQGYKVRIIRRFEIAEDALKHEEELHLKHGLLAKGGKLINQLIGGSSPVKLTELWKAKISKTLKNFPPEKRAQINQAIASSNTGKIFSESHRKRISISKRNPPKETRERLSSAAKNRTEEHKAKIGLSHRGKVISDEQKEKIRKSLLKGAKTRAEKISKATKGRPKSEAWKKKMAEAMRQYWSKNPKRSVSEETRRKLSLASKKIKRTPEWRKRISDANKGKVFSEEHRRNIAKARQRFLQSNRLARIHK